jgi:hypothetical protein
MKTKIIVLAVVFAVLGGVAFSAAPLNPWSLHLEMDLFLSLKVGVEYQFSDTFGIRGDLGVCVISPTQIGYTLIGIAHLMTPDSPFQCDIQFGLIQDIFDVLGQYIYSEPSMQHASAYWVPGACLSVGYRSPTGHQIGMRAGAGVLFGYDLDAWRVPSFMPNLAIEYSWRNPE